MSEFSILFHVVSSRKNVSNKRYVTHHVESFETIVSKQVSSKTVNTVTTILFGIQTINFHNL